MSKVEEVAEAIMQAAVSGKGYHDIARAAIEAMREPTDAMVEAMNDTRDDEGYSFHPETWSAGIDAALNEQVAG